MAQGPVCGVSVHREFWGRRFSSPVILASGTAGFGLELMEFGGLEGVAAIVTKATTLEPRAGNVPPRIAETRFGLINSIGVLFILQVIAVKIGGLGLMKHVPPAVPGVLEVFEGVMLSKQRLAALIVATVLLLLIWLFLTRTKLGWALRATAQDREAAALQGININRISMIAMGLGAAAAGVAGALMAPLTRVQPYMGHKVIITAFIVTIVGGLGSLSGAILAAVLYAFFHTFVTTYYGGVIASILGLIIMLIVLVVKPAGLMGTQTTE